LRRLRENPLTPLLSRLGLKAGWEHFLDDLGRCANAYEFYYLSLTRCLPELAVVLRWRLAVYFARKHRKPYTPNRVRLAKRYREIAPFVELDIVNCVIYARILVDHVATLSRRFLPNPDLPIRSFHAHRDFFVKLDKPFGTHEEYAKHMREKTGWFPDMKEIRDKYLVHPGPKHFRLFGALSGDAEAMLSVGRFVQREPRLIDVVTYSVTVVRLARDLDGFLHWFNDYGMRAMAEKEGKGPGQGGPA